MYPQTGGRDMKLSGATVAQAKPREKKYKLSDGGGMYLEVTPTGRKYWRFKYRFFGREKLLALGVYPEVSLKQARIAHQSARAQLAEEIDPSAARRAGKLARRLASHNSFEEVAREWFHVRQKDKSAGHKTRTTKLLEKELFPYIGHHPIAEIGAPE